MNALIAFFDKIDQKLDRIGAKLEGKVVRYNPSLVGSLLFIVFGVVFLIIMPQQIHLTGSDTINAQTFPRLLLQLILFFSVIIFIKEIVKMAMHKKCDMKELHLLVEVRTLIILALLVGYLLLLKPIGFILSSVLFGIALICYFRVRKWYYYLIVATAAVLIGVLFQMVLHVRLP